MPHGRRLALPICEMDVASSLHITALLCRSRKPRKDTDVHNTAETPERAASSRRGWSRKPCKMLSAGRRGTELPHSLICEVIPSPRPPVECQGFGHSASVLLFKAVTELKSAIWQNRIGTTFFPMHIFPMLQRAFSLTTCHCDMTEATQGVQHLRCWDSRGVSSSASQNLPEKPPQRS